MFTNLCNLLSCLLRSNKKMLVKTDNPYTRLFRPASARTYKISVVGNNWLVGWLIGNAAFSKTALTIFLAFVLKLVLNMTFNSNETYFSEKLQFEVFGREIVKKLSKLRFLSIFSTLHL